MFLNKCKHGLCELPAGGRVRAHASNTEVISPKQAETTSLPQFSVQDHSDISEQKAQQLALLLIR